MQRYTRNRLLALVVLALLAGVIVGCAVGTIGAPTVTTTVTVLPPAGQPTAVASMPGPTATTQATATSMAAATATLQPTNTPMAGPTTTKPAPAATSTQVLVRPERISFSPGATSATIQADLPAGGVAQYVLRVLAGQLLEVSVEPREALDLSIVGADGTVLLGAEGGGALFRGPVPTTQDYVLTLTTGPNPVSYTLDVVVPQRITFAQGATSALVQGDLAAYQTQYYVLHASASQLMEVSVTTPGNTRLSIYGQDGTILLSGASQSAFFRGLLPSTQDYVLAVAAGSEATSYTMEVIIPERISFTPGATSAVLTGNLPAGMVQYYVLRASGGQTMEVYLRPEGSLRLAIYGEDGTVLASGMSSSSTFKGTLPSTQEYIVVVGPGPQTTQYDLQVAVY